MSNYGIMDQMAVLQWVQENIVQFGGDPQRVTLFGHGTGAACIEYLTHSPTTVPGKPEYLIAIAECAQCDNCHQMWPRSVKIGLFRTEFCDSIFQF